MARSIPIFSDERESVQADACEPLVQAALRREIRLRAFVHGHYPGVELPPETLPSLQTAGYWDAASGQKWGLPWHRNEGIEITFVDAGRLAFGVDGQEFDLGPDDLTITRPWQRHHVGNPHVGPGRLVWMIVDVGVRQPNQLWQWPSWVILSRPDLVELTGLLHRTEHPVWRANAEIRRCFQAVAQAVELERTEAGVSRLAVRINDLLLLLLDLLRAHHVPAEESRPDSMRVVEAFLAELGADPARLGLDWTEEQMAEFCGLGVTQFVHYTRRLVNVTPMRYLKDRRLEVAARMLKQQTSLHVTDVALACGFSSSHYFATVFSTRYGCSPTDYRRT